MISISWKDETEREGRKEGRVVGELEKGSELASSSKLLQGRGWC